MVSLRDIRKRLQSIQNIQQLTKAMEMVAASRLHHVQMKVKQSRPYVNKIKDILDQLSQVASTDYCHPLLEQREVKKVGVVVIAADMGLSGSYNKDVFSATNKFLKSYKQDQVELILVGRKAVEYYRRRSWPIRYELEEWGEKLTQQQVMTFANDLVSWFLLGELDEVWFVYTHYITMMSRKVVVEKFLNISQSSKEESKGAAEYLFEPAPQEIYGAILLRYCLTKVQTTLNEAYASELAARIFAMKAATTNADDMIEKLTLVRNKVRQAGITKEMLEITSGAEGLK
ncbi:putative F-type ATP synthase, subunit gamma [Candidatus Protochlamydia naegleriophila]|uniref:ATP synthase gamma chain n=1 Tax=Candidatus Protochlamydia naegleriophila TaxID=389348 RepID=A0A0U5K578_9BACT|nr:ATP synthase F1 subunit gamma [Candidatus Protochlamydia naegleriophila]CUI17259.1 putative F-type ATP synthase, subunit gamma [Candidatus Protochlamydia naegleriophila]